MELVLESSSAERRRTSPASEQLLYVPCIRGSEISFVAFDIYIVPTPVDGDCLGGVISPALIIEDKRHNFCTVCVSASKLYMFQSSHNFGDNPDPSGSNGTAVATVNLSNYVRNRNVRLEDKMISYINPMHHPKRFPIAIETPKGEILVCSNHIRINSGEDDGKALPPADFELYNQATGNWKQLPCLYDSWDKDRKRSCSYSISIECVTFRSESAFIIVTKMGMFELDLESSGRGWQDFSLARKIPRPYGPFIRMKDGVCLSSHCGFDVETPKEVSLICPFLREAFDPALGFRRHSGVGIIKTQSAHHMYYCIVETVINERTRCPHMAVYIFSCDLAKYREDKQELIAKHWRDWRILKAKYRRAKKKLKANKEYRKDDEGKQRKAREALKMKHRWDLSRLKIEHIPQLNATLVMTVKYVLDTPSCSLLAPLSLSFV
ncbi:Golgin subfamily A member 4 isoform 1 [Striga asiatica]|uniref:Golgin subfamily A member 4 isoform 1 n=1 Tax=Striga asiatica TaxID=4170 RepID=A0A5A7Q6C2_STRAF|nr:Golgin subfamily A member 4 isoform 1 [Striga asiatica]